MSNTFLFANDASSTLASPISSTATSVTLATGTGALFPTPSSNQQFALTFNDAATGLLTEIVYCTAISGDTLTIVRAQEGTTALSWLAGDLAANLLTAGTMDALLQVATGGIRIRLLANATYYVSTTGSDSNPGTSGSPWATLQHAWNYISDNIDFNGFTITVQIANGTYTAGVLAEGPLVGASGSGSLIFQGNSTVADVILSGSGTAAFEAVQGAVFTVQGMTIEGSWTYGLLASTLGIIIVGGTGYPVAFGAMTSAIHVAATFAGNITFNVAYQVVGGAATNMFAQFGGTIQAETQASLTGTPAFSTAFAHADSGGVISAAGFTFTGSATGSRYSATLNGVINTVGGGSSVFPGNSAGTTATGGQYA